MIFIKICLVALVIMQSSCAEDKKMENVFYKGTESYQKQVKSFAVGYEQSLEKVITYYRKLTGRLEGPIAIGSNEIIIGNWYLFSFSEKTKIPLSGICVNGKTSEIVVLETKKFIDRADKPRKIQIEIKAKK